jgi:hypothetical protein
MRNYRLYVVDLFTGDVKNHHEFEAEDDSAATVEADRLRGKAPIELWRRTRRIAKWPALL